MQHAILLGRDSWMRLKIDDLFAPLGRFDARLSASAATVDCRYGLGFVLPTSNPAFASVLVVPSRGDEGSAEAPAVATSVAQYAPLPTSTLQGDDSAVITGSAASFLSTPDNPALRNTLPPSARISTQTRR